MKSIKSRVSMDASQEMTTLIETLLQTGRRLEELTAGQVDTVADREGRTFLLRGTQEQLRQSEVSRQAAILNALAAPVALLDTKGVIISVNDAWRRFATAKVVQGPGYSVGLNYLELCESAQGEGSYEAHLIAKGIRSVLDGEQKSLSTEYPCQSPTEQLWFLLTVTPLTDERRSGAVVMHLDITERKRAEDAFRRSELRLRKLMDSSIIGVGTGTPEGRIIDGNAAFLKLLGYSREELISGTLHWDMLTPPAYRDVDQHAIDQLTSRGVATTWEKEFIRKDGSRIAVLIGAVMLTMEHGDMEVVSYVVDISERKQLEQQLRMGQKMEAVGQLAGGVAHDFNNLIGVIIGYSEMIQDKLHQADPLCEKIEEVLKAGRRAAVLTHQLLVFSRQQVVEPKTLNLNTIVSDMNKMLPRMLGEHIELATILAKDLACVKADQGHIEQVIMNLAVNARDAMAEGGKLTIETANVELDEHYCLHRNQVLPGSYVMLAVTDTGIGMDAGTQTRIFEPFFTTKEMGKGTGLGLATVYGAVKQSGGSVWVYSELGHGTTFKIYLPRVPGEADKETQDAGSRKLLIGTETVLLVEDEESLNKLTAEILQECGYSVLKSRNGVDALEVAGRYEGTIHLLLTDVVMPKMGGPALAKQLAVLRPEMKLLYMSGYTGSSVVTQDLVDSGSVLVQKPFTRDTLTSKVREVLDFVR